MLCCFGSRQDSEDPPTPDVVVAKAPYRSRASIIRQAKEGKQAQEDNGVDADEKVEKKKSVGVHSVRYLAVGQTVSVMCEFRSDGKRRVLLKKDTSGKVVEVREDGDALIKFDSHQQRQLVLHSRQMLLRVTAEAPVAPKAGDKAEASVESQATSDPEMVPDATENANEVSEEEQEAELPPEVTTPKQRAPEDRNSNERRIDPADGVSRTLAEVHDAYRGLYRPEDIDEYWDYCTPIDPEPSKPPAVVSQNSGKIAPEDPPTPLEVGSDILVLEDFESDSATSVKISKGSQGTVTKLNADGDACIDFSHLDTSQWVFHTKFGKLQVQVQELQVGMSVTVRENFMSDSQSPVQLQKGCAGKVEKINEEGDACINFVKVPNMQWVFKSNHKFLQIEKELVQRVDAETVQPESVASLVRKENIHDEPAQTHSREVAVREEGRQVEKVQSDPDAHPEVKDNINVEQVSPDADAHEKRKESDAVDSGTHALNDVEPAQPNPGAHEKRKESDVVDLGSHLREVEQVQPDSDAPKVKRESTTSEIDLARLMSDD
eukprot:TRINITY_DN31629_c0_g1_i1.p1 TRINITY_DN31629_c0_g1~~TRINITY_DN31629_c0_g1_i1.p1  ORF type:complete len:547 (+),score=81.99 TRINITY_DN31629_c0_g1_i1:82-1722(+)